MLFSSEVLQPKERVYFNPANRSHITDFAAFLKHSSWKNGCKYILEEPFLDVPTMINHKLVRYHLRRIWDEV